jgi:NADH:ubiquinone oxidoreductase subunit 4 (subunit M)
MLRSYQAIMLGPLRDSLPAFGALRTSESAVLAVVAALVIAAGVYPGFLTTISEAAVLDLLRMTR